MCASGVSYYIVVLVLNQWINEVFLERIIVFKNKLDDQKMY